MSSVNKVFLLGNLTRDPELKYAQNGGNAICNIGIAVNRQWTNQDGSKGEDVCFVDVTIFGKQGESANQYLRKGRQVHIEGRLHLDQWDDRETGQKRSRLKVIAERVTFVGNREGGQQGDGGQSGGYSADSRNQQGDGQRQQQTGGQHRPPQRPAQQEQVDFDDIPF